VTRSRGKRTERPILAAGLALPRRAFLIQAGACVVLARARVARAQQQAGVFRVGILATDSFESRRALVEVFVGAMRELGYVEGRNIVYEGRYASGDTARLSALAAELVRLNPHVMVVSNSLAVEAAARAAEEIKSQVPIVFSGWGTPTATRFVASLARPGGNVTGLTNVNVELAGKQLQLLKEAFPRISRLAVFVDSTTLGAQRYLGEIQRAAKVFGVQTLPVEVRGVDDMDRSVAMLRRWGADSMFIANNPVNSNNRKLLVEIAALTKLPAMYANAAYAEIGGLMSYASDDKVRWRQLATYVDKILKGARAGDLPIESPTKFELVINLKTAKALGVTIPQAVLLRADRVIE
jgi:putative ABC transport system substrate-binding protein